MTDEEMHGYLPNDGSAEECPNFLGKIDNRDWKVNNAFGETPEEANKFYWWAKQIEYEELYAGTEPAVCYEEPFDIKYLNSCPIKNAINMKNKTSPQADDILHNVHGFERIKDKAFPITKDVSDQYAMFTRGWTLVYDYYAPDCCVVAWDYKWSHEKYLHEAKKQALYFTFTEQLVNAIEFMENGSILYKNCRGVLPEPLSASFLTHVPAVTGQNYTDVVNRPRFGTLVLDLQAPFSADVTYGSSGNTELPATGLDELDGF